MSTLPKLVIGSSVAKHCCSCSGVCGHIGGPFYCDEHRRENATTNTGQNTIFPGTIGNFALDINYLHRRINQLELEIQELKENMDKKKRSRTIRADNIDPITLMNAVNEKAHIEIPSGKKVKIHKSQKDK